MLDGRFPLAVNHRERCGAVAANHLGYIYPVAMIEIRETTSFAHWFSRLGKAYPNCESATDRVIGCTMYPKVKI